MVRPGATNVPSTCINGAGGALLYQLSLAVAMQSFTVAIAILCSLSFSSGGVVRRSVESKPYENAKELLSMKGAGEAIKKSFESAGSDLEALADELDKEVTSIADLAAYINGTETEKMSEALAEAKNIQSVSKYNFFIFSLD